MLIYQSLHYHCLLSSVNLQIGAISARLYTEQSYVETVSCLIDCKFLFLLTQSLKEKTIPISKTAGQ